MKLKLKNQTILITGSGSGIGRGIADGFLKEGAYVIITDLNKNYLASDDLQHYSLDSNYAWFDTGNPDEMFAASMYVKSIQDRTNSMIGCIEGESWKQGNITEEEFKRIVKKMPDCSYKTNVAMSYFFG